MISFIHDNEWRADLNSCIETTVNSLRTLGNDEGKKIPGVIAADLEDKNSDYCRFIEVFFDDVRFDAELLFARETQGNDSLTNHKQFRKKDIRKINMERFNCILEDSFIFCGMSKDYGYEFRNSVRDLLNDSIPHQSFLYELYEVITLRFKYRQIAERKN